MALAIGLLLLCPFAGPARAEDPPREYAVKAAFLVNFVRLVTWPDSAHAGDGPFTICVLGERYFSGGGREGPVGGELAGHTLVVRARDGATDLEGCQVVFVTEEARGQTGAVLSTATGRAVLTVGETEEFIQAGGIIRFFDQGRKIRFAINPDAAKAADLQISSRLLRLARRESSR